jgi:hypothetical protein
MLKNIQTLIAIIVVLLGGLWWVYDTRALAEVAEKQTRSNEEQIELLTDIHLKQQAAEDAEKALIEKLCREGKLKEGDCPQRD